MVKDGTKTYFPAYDGNGNVSALLDSADGSLDAKYEYGAFGEPLRVGGAAIAEDNPFRFSTKYTDTDEARQRVDGDAEGVARRAEEAGAPLGADEAIGAGLLWLPLLQPLAGSLPQPRSNWRNGRN